MRATIYAKRPVMIKGIPDFGTSNNMTIIIIYIVLGLERGSQDKRIGLLYEKNSDIFQSFNLKATKGLTTCLIIYCI